MYTVLMVEKLPCLLAALAKSARAAAAASCRLQNGTFF
jgi:hypothetical protein